MFRLVITLVDLGWADPDIYALLSSVPGYMVRYAIVEAVLDA